MRRSLKNVKEEIRILGLDACNPRVVVGAVVRGGLYLDGVVVFPRRLRAGQLANEIKSSKYFPELRTIMVHDLHRDLSSETIERITRLPTIRVSLDGRSWDRGTGVLYKRQYKLRIRTRLDQSSLRKVLGITQVISHVPEPLRIAHLLAKLHIFGRISQEKDKILRTLSL